MASCLEMFVYNKTTERAWFLSYECVENYINFYTRSNCQDTLYLKKADFIRVVATAVSIIDVVPLVLDHYDIY